MKAGYDFKLLSLAGEPPSFIGVPTHFFKVVLGECSSTEDGENRTAVGAFCDAKCSNCARDTSDCLQCAIAAA